MANLFLVLSAVLVFPPIPCQFEEPRTTDLPPDDSCPSGCQCMPMDGQGYITDCLNQGFTSFPKTLPVNSSQIYLSGNTIKRVEEDALARYRQIRVLVLSESGVEEMTPGAFDHVQELTSMDLKDNRIRVLRERIFSGLKKLQKVVLDRNQLTTIENFAFSGIGMEDEGVSLSIIDNSDLANIGEQAFDGANIQELILKGCSLTSASLKSLQALKDSLSLLFLEDNGVPLTIPSTVFAGFQFHGISLENNGIRDTSFLEHLSTGVLSLKNNPIGPVNFSQYTDLSNTRELHLGSTNFHRVHPDYFMGLTRLSDLDLSENGITDLPERVKPVFVRLQKLSLTGNPLHCNCDLAWFRTWLTSRSHKVIGADCVTPFKATPMVRSEHSAFTCSPPTSVRIARQLEEGMAMLVCKANGDPPPTLIWTTPNGEHITAKPPQYDQNYTGKTKAHLPLRETDKSGMYSCEASNRKGSSSDSIKVDVFKTMALARSDEHNHSSRSEYRLGFCMLTTLGLVCWQLWGGYLISRITL